MSTKDSSIIWRGPYLDGTLTITSSSYSTPIVQTNAPREVQFFMEPNSGDFRYEGEAKLYSTSTSIQELMNTIRHNYLDALIVHKKNKILENSDNVYFFNQ